MTENSRNAIVESVTVIAGGVGGAKLSDGFLRAGTDLTVIVNTADDIVLHGLDISPDLDTVMYTLAGMVNPQTGWGVEGDTVNTLEGLRRLGEDTWFLLGDRDFATHIARTVRRRAGATLAEVTTQLVNALGINARLLPMTNDPVATLVDTPDGRWGFQKYFVARRHQDHVLALTYSGVEQATPAPGVLEAIATAGLVVIAPSNPLLSVAPVLAVPGIRSALADTSARRIAVSPIVAGRALKGPAAAVLAAQGHEVSALGVARLYAGLVDTMCIDEADAALAPAIENLGMSVLVAQTVMDAGPGRERLARQLLLAP